MSKITVVTACFNSRAFIGDTVASVRNQDISDWEHIVVDDGSIDGTSDVVSEIAQVDSRVRIVKQSNAGTCRARNLGASMCSADCQYLLFLDHDDMLEPGALRVLSNYLDGHPDVGVVGCQFQEVDADGTHPRPKTRSRWAPSKLGIPRSLSPEEYETPFATFYCATGQGPFAMFRRSIFEQVGGWTTEFWPHEDTDLFCKMALLGKVHYLPDRLYRKRIHQTNALKDIDRLMNAYGAFREKWDRFEPRNVEEAETIREAAHFYRASFRPLRHVKVGTKALGEFVRHGDTEKLRWALRLFGTAARDAVRYRISSMSIL